MTTPHAPSVPAGRPAAAYPSEVSKMPEITCPECRAVPAHRIILVTVHGHAWVRGATGNAVACSVDGRRLSPTRQPEPVPTYKIVRFYRNRVRNRKIMRYGLTRAEAQAWCSRDDTKDPRGKWFDGFERDGGETHGS